MRLAGLPNTRAQKRQSNIKRHAYSFDTETQPLERSVAESDGLVLDSHTLKDLEVFESEHEGRSLYNFCKFTRTEGGAKILKQRMQLPWSDPAHIHATQQSVAYIIENRTAFAKLPAYIVQGVENYQREILLMVLKENLFEFSLSAFSIWLNHDRHYQSIVRGVQFSCGLVRSLRTFLNQDELAQPPGELAAIIEEMRELLERPKLQLVPDHEVADLRPWQFLRLDQNFRSIEKKAILRLLQLVYEADALISMADVTAKHEFTLPEIVEGPVAISAEGLEHPYLEDAVPNPVELNQHSRLLFLTGPNMAGKTTYLRSCATAVYFAHLGMGVPAQSFSFVPIQRLFSSISLNDNLYDGVSYFRAEALRVKAVAQAIADGYSVLALMDEPFKGTNVKDAYDASLAILSRFAAKENCLFMFSSHLIELDEELDAGGQISRYHFKAEEGEGKLRFDYALRPGVSSQRLGVRVLREEGVFDLLDQNS